MLRDYLNIGIENSNVRHFTTSCRVSICREQPFYILFRRIIISISLASINYVTISRFILKLTTNKVVIIFK